MDRAIAIETARGRPSGIATIKRTTAIMTTLPILRRVSLVKIYVVSPLTAIIPRMKIE